MTSLDRPLESRQTCICPLIQSNRKITFTAFYAWHCTYNMNILWRTENENKYLFFIFCFILINTSGYLIVSFLRYKKLSICFIPDFHQFDEYLLNRLDIKIYNAAVLRTLWRDKYLFANFVFFLEQIVVFSIPWVYVCAG